MVKMRIYILCLLGVSLLVYSFWDNSKRAFPAVFSLKRDEEKMSYMNVFVHGEERLAHLDLGSRFTRVDGESIKKGYTKANGTKGISHTVMAAPVEEDILILDDLSLGPLHLKNLEVRPPLPIKTIHISDIGEEAVIYNEIESPLTLGRTVFLSHCLLIDLKKNEILLLNDISEIPSTDYKNRGLKKINSHFFDEGIAIPGFYKNEIVNFCLDNGSTVNIALSKDQEIVKSEFFLFKLSDADITFDHSDIVAGQVHESNIPMPPHMGGILGVPFFEKNIVLIDFPKKEIYIAPHN